MVGRGSTSVALRLLATLALVTAPAIMVLGGPTASALTTISVTTPTDAALRAAFTTANATADNVEIDINVGAGPIKLTAGELLYNGGGGNFALTDRSKAAARDSDLGKPGRTGQPRARRRSCHQRRGPRAVLACMRSARRRSSKVVSSGVTAASPTASPSRWSASAGLRGSTGPCR